MTSRQFESDDFLLSELKAAYDESLQVPAEAVDAAKASLTWRLVDEELETLTLCFDSAVDDVALVRNGSSAAPRTLSFEGAQVSVEIEVDADGITGQLIPPQLGQVRVSSAAEPEASADASTDGNGCFVVRRPANGPFRLECTTADASFTTEWVAG